MYFWKKKTGTQLPVYCELKVQASVRLGCPMKELELIILVGLDGDERFFCWFDSLIWQKTNVPFGEDEQLSDVKEKLLIRIRRELPQYMKYDDIQLMYFKVFG